MNTLTTDVVIVGAGPTGLMAANQLARFGVNFIIIDGKPGPTIQSRAIAVTARSLEIYEQMGVIDEVLGQGQRINSFNFFSQGKKRGEIVIGDIGVGMTDYHFLLGYEQSKNEELLVSHLQSMGHEVIWNTSFTSFIDDGKNIETTTSGGTDQIIIHSKYLFACDGASSPVRHQLNVKFKGGTYENKFFVADTDLTWKLGYDQLVISPADENFVAFFPMKGNSNYRVLGTMPEEFSNVENVIFQQIEDVVKKTVGIDLTFNKVNWFSMYKLHHRRVEQMKIGNVFLAGDAAHIHSPAGGQGMNTGLQDAYNIAWKLAFVLKGYCGKNLLETYNEERLPFAKWLMSFTDRGFNILTNDNRFLAFGRKYLAPLLVSFILKNKFVQPIAFRTMSQIWYSYHGMSLSSSSTRQKLKFKSGDRLPYIMDQQSGKSLYLQLKQPSFHLIRIGTYPKPEGPKIRLDAFPFPVKIIDQPISESWKKYGVKKELFVLVRPDNYIMSISDNLTEISLSIILHLKV